MKKIKFMARDKIHKDIKEVAVINWVSKKILLWNVRGNVRITIERDFDDVELVDLLESEVGGNEKSSTVPVRAL